MKLIKTCFIFILLLAALTFLSLSLHSFVFAGKGPSDTSIDTVASVTFDQPVSVEEVMKMKESVNGQVSLIESDFTLGSVTVHDFYPITPDADSETIKSDYLNNRRAGLRDFLKDKDSLSTEQRKELAPQYEASEKLLKESSREEVKVSKAMIAGKKDNLEKVKKHQKVRNVEIKDIDAKVDKNKEPKRIPDRKVTLGSGDITSLAATTGSTWIPNSGTSITGVAAEGGRYTRQYMKWGTMVFAHEDTYEHDFYFYNFDRLTYLNATSTAYPNCFPVAYASTTWPAASMPYMDSRNGYPDRIGCDVDELSYAIGAARADQLSAGVTYNNYFRTKNGNASSDKFKINAQLGYRTSDTCYTTWCSWSDSQVRLVPAWSTIIPGTLNWVYTAGKPAAPSSVFVTNPTSSSLQINFTDNATNEAGIKVERKTGTLGTWGQIATFAELPNTGGWYWVNSGLAANTTYCYRLRAYNTYGNSAYSNESCGKTNPVSTRTEVIIDDTSGGFSRGGSYWWEANIGYGGHMYWTYVNGSVVDSWGDWTATLGGGNYEVYAFIPSNYATTANAKYQIYNTAGTTVRTVNQNNYYDVWVSLGTYGFSSGTARRVRLTDATGETNYALRVGFDAMRFVPR